MSADRETLAFYRDGAEDYTEFSRRHGVPPRLARMAETLPPDARVLDLGCGAGWVARWLRDQGYAVTALDPVPEFLAPLAEAGIETIEGGALTLDRPGGFEAIWSNCALQHMPRADMPEALDRIAAALVPGGRLELALHEGETDLRDTLGRLYCEWSEADLRALIEARGMTIGQVTHRALTGYDGRPITIMAISATK